MRFADLQKIPDQPGLRMLAVANAKLETKLDLPASAPVYDMLNALDAEKAYIDVIRLLAVVMPVREGIWWACLAGRDCLDGQQAPKTLETAEIWVRKPNEETREDARVSLEGADSDDPTMLCAMAVGFHDGKLGGGELNVHDAPAGASASAIFGMNISALENVIDFEHNINILIDRGIDIANGGTGDIALEPEKELDL